MFVRDLYPSLCEIIDQTREKVKIQLKQQVLSSEVEKEIKQQLSDFFKAEIDRISNTMIQYEELQRTKPVSNIKNDCCSQEKKSNNNPKF